MNTFRSHRLNALLFACLATFAGGQAQAVTFPSVPLESGVLYPPPNVRLILDDSGSMNLIAMPADIEDPTDGSGNGATRAIDYTRISDASFANNSIYFNPATLYQPWMTHNGTRMAAASYTAASRDTSLLTQPENLANSYQTWYVPKVDGFKGGSNVDYWRYQIVPDSSTNIPARRRVVKSEWVTLPPGPTQTPVPFPVTNLSNQSNSQGFTNLQTWTVPANVLSMTVTLTGGTHGSNASPTNNNGNGADLYVDDDNNPSNNPVCSSGAGANVETCTIANPVAGPWWANIYRESKYAGVTMNVVLQLVAPAETGVANVGCATSTTGADWRRCEFANPSTTVDAVQRQNYANWYHYHRSRMKVAKAGASEAFSDLDINLRIGYDSINRGGATPYNIPVDNDDGLFRGDNKEDWYSVLQAEDADGSTLLHRALQRAGNYYSDAASATSPYRTSSNASILACRQNFAILTTDGYWNSTSGYTAVGDADGTNGPTHSGPEDPDWPYVSIRPYHDNLATAANRRADTLADVAMHYWKTDLVTGLTNNVPNSNDDPAFWQHMVTFGVSIGLNGTLNPSTDVEQIEIGAKEWPDTRPDTPGTVSASRIDDLLHASVNGRGSFVVASNTNEFATALKSAFELLDSRTGSGSNVSTNSTSTSSDDAVYQASYDTGRWSGTLKSFAVADGRVAELPTWLASIPPAVDRNIFTWNPTLEAGAAFPTAAQVTALDRSTRVEGPVSGTDNAAYLRGDRSLETTAGGLRKRDSTLGDIANSSPYYDPHTQAIYVGANDGMLHAFDEVTGEELMAYVPGGVNLTDLADLSSPVYGHDYFVDGPVVVTSFRQTPGRNFLIGALGRGGKSLFGLDVTDVENFENEDVLWELSDSNLGNVLGEPLITKLQDGTDVAIVGNGLNSTGGSSVLFVIDVETGEILHELDTGVTGGNGMFAPRGWDDNRDDLVDRVFAADYLGNVWKFDFTSSTPTIALGGDPLFTTTTGQPITSGIGLAFNASKLWVFFGTGAYLETDDTEDETVQSIYGVIDNNESVTRAQLQARDIATVGTSGTVPVRAFQTAATLPGAAKGWYVDLDTPTPGERIVTRPFVVGETLLFSSRIPPFDDTDQCAPGGTGFINAIGAFTGTATSNPFAGTLHDGRTVAGTINGQTVGSIDLGINMPTQPAIISGVLVVGGSTGELGWIPIGIGTGDPVRSSWREIEGN